MDIKVKICGLSSAETVASAIDSGADYLGFIFYPKSPRNVTVEQAAELVSGVSVDTVAVVVDADDDLLDDIVTNMKPNYLQLHGSESAARVQEVKNKYGLKIIKALKIRTSDDVAKAKEYQQIADILLFDARASDNMPGALPGGNGISFDWQLLKGREFSVPWMLSGGLNESNIEDAIKTTNAKIIDVSSSLEIDPGKKDIKLIESFMNKVKEIKNA